MKYFIPVGFETFEEMEEFVSYIKKYQEKLEGIYFCDSRYPKKFSGRKALTMDLAKEFLFRIKDVPIEKFCILNNPHSRFLSDEIGLADNLVRGFGDLITGFTVTNFHVARYINQLNPNLKIDISCHAALYNIPKISYWKKYCNLFSINLPRRLTREIKNIKKYKEYCEKINVKIKIILNETCTPLCPFEGGCHNLDGRRFCETCSSPEDLLRSNYTIPSQMEKLNKYVDIGKLISRGYKPEVLFKLVDIYEKGSDDGLKIKDLFKVFNPDKEILVKFKNVEISQLPKKIFDCCSNDCYPLGNCTVCKDFIEELRKKN